MRFFILGLAVLGLAFGARAQEAEVQPEWELQAFVATEMCLRGEGPEADRSPDCRGIIYEACPNNAGSTTDMVLCTASETRFWDGQLNANYRALMSVYRAGDEVEGEDSPYKLAQLLQDAQRAWIAYRDASCKGFERNRFRGGSLGRLTAAACIEDMTAKRAQELEDLLEQARM